MAENKKQVNYTIENFELKKWLRENKDHHHRLLAKLKNDLRNLGLSKRERRRGLIQLSMKPCVILIRLPESCDREGPLQSSHNSKENVATFHKEKAQNEHRDDAKKKQQEENTRDIPQQSDTQIRNVVQTASINVTDTSQICQCQECNLLRKKSSDNTILDFTSKVLNEDSHIDVTSTNLKDYSAEKSDIEAGPSSSSSKDELLWKHTHNSILSKATIKRKVSSGSNFDQDKLIKIKYQQENEGNTLKGKIVVNSNIEISNYKIQTDDELVYTNSESTTKYLRQRENYKLLKGKQFRKEKNKIKKIREKFHEYFRGNFDLDTSENEEEREILLNYLKKNKEHDPLHDIIINKEVEHILKRDKKLTNDILTNNLQKDTESAIPAKVKSNILCDTIVCHSTKNVTYDGLNKRTEDEAGNSTVYPIYSKSYVTDEKINDEVSICKRDTSINNSQKNVKSVNSEKSCDFDTYTEKYYSVHELTSRVVDKLFCKRGTLADNSQENTSGVIPAKIQQENTSITDTKNSSKSNTRIEYSSDITPSTIKIHLDKNIENIHLNQNIEKKAATTYTEAEEINMQATLQNRQEDQKMHNVENVDLTQRRDMQQHATLNLELPEYESCNVREKDGCDMSQNVENILSINDVNIARNERTIDKLSVTTSKAERNSSEQRNNDSCSIQLLNLSMPSNISDYSDNANSLQQQNLQDYPILSDNRNTMNRNQEGRDKRTQSSVIQKRGMTTENNSRSSKVAGDTFDLVKQLLMASTDDKQKTNEKQKSQDSLKITLEGSRIVTQYNQRKKAEYMSSVERKKSQMATENSFETVKAAYNTPNVREQLPQTLSNVTHSKARVQSAVELSCQCTMKSMRLHGSTSRSACSFCQSVSFQSIPLQSASPQSVPQPTRPQLVPLQLMSSQLAPSKTTFSQSIPVPSVSQSTRPSLPPFQSISSRLVSFQSVPQATRPQLVSPQLIPSLLTPPQSVPEQSLPTNTNLYLSSQTNSPVVPIGSDTPTNHFVNVIQATLNDINLNVEYCRNVVRYTLKIKYLPRNVHKMQTAVKRIKQDLDRLRRWIHKNDFESTITFVNQHILKKEPLTLLELFHYSDFVRMYFMQLTPNLGHNAQSNALQYPNAGGSVPNASLPNVNARPFLRNAPFPNARMQNHTQTSTMPRPTISNINQQQLVTHSRKPTPNTRQQYTSYVPPTARFYAPSTIPSYVPPTTHSYIPNINQQQSLGNASHPVQGQYTPSANIGIQQSFANMSNVSSSNVNMCSYKSANQRTANAPPTFGMRQSRVASKKNTISSTATTSVASAQQQKQIHCQTLQMNSATTIYPPYTTNQNAPLERHQTTRNVTLSKSLTRNPNIPITNVTMGNVTHSSANVNQSQASCSWQVSQASSEKMQSLPQYTLNPNNIYLLVQGNMQTHPVQNILPVNVQQIPQQKLSINQRNVNVPPTTNTSQSNVASKKTSTINSTTTARQHRLQHEDISAYPINLLSNTLQNIQQNNKGAKISKSQNKNRVQKKIPSMNPQQDVSQGTSGVYNVSQNITGTIPKTSTSQRSGHLQNTSKISSQKNNAKLPSSKLHSTHAQTKKGSIYNFNMAILTDIQKIVLQNQILSYFNMPYIHLINNQEYGRTLDERKMLYYLSQCLKSCIRNIIKKSQTIKKSAKKESQKSSQDNTSQNNLVLQKNTIQMSVDKLTKIQFYRDNENSLVYNKNLKEQSSEQSVDSNISKNSKSTVVKSNLEASNKESTTKESLSKNTRLQEQSNTLKKQFQKSSLVEMEKELESTETSSSGHSKTKENSITQVLANEISSNMKTKSVRETSNVVMLNSGGNDGTSRTSCNTEDENNEVYNVNNKISNENLQDGMRDDVRENIEILNSTQSDLLNILHGSESSSSNNVWESIKKCESTKISHPQITLKEHAKTISELCLNPQEKDSTNERSDNSINETSENSGKLYIDESPKKQEQHDNVSSSDGDNLKQDSISDTIRCDSTKATSLSLLKNIAEVDVSYISQDFIIEAQNITEELNEEPLVETEQMQLQATILRLKDEWNIEENIIQSIDTTKKCEDIKENDNKQSLLKAEEIQLQEMSSKFDISEDSSSIGNIAILELPEDVEEEMMAIDTHNSIKIINQQLKHVSEQKYYRQSRTCPRNAAQTDHPVEVNVQEALAKNNVLNTDSIECISVKSDDDSEVTEFMPSIVNFGTISTSLFENIENMDAFFPDNSESLIENEGELSGLNDNQEIPNDSEVDDVPCLRCRRKSSVCCVDCLEACYCSRRCSVLHWNTEHHKTCKGRNAVICID